MSNRVKILDHGYLELVEAWGSDESVICAARMSTGKGFLGWGSENCVTLPGLHGGVVCSKGTVKCSVQHVGDERLLRYLWKNKHTTPFEVPGLTVEVCCPMVVVWQWVRHRTMTYNILSGRYAEMPDSNYVPTVERMFAGSEANKQAGTVEDAVPLSHATATAYQYKLECMHKNQQELYQWALKNGVPKELARLHLGLDRYTRMRVTANLWNWLRFLTLRLDHHSQSEIRQYANAVGDLIAEKFPRTWALFVAK